MLTRLNISTYWVPHREISVSSFLCFSIPLSISGPLASLQTLRLTTQAHWLSSIPSQALLLASRPSCWLPDPLAGVQTLRRASQVLWLASRSSGQPPIPSCYYIFRLASQTLWLTFRPSQAYWLACQCLGALIAVPRVSASTVLWEYKKKIWY